MRKRDVAKYIMQHIPVGGELMPADQFALVLLLEDAQGHAAPDAPPAPDDATPRTSTPLSLRAVAEGLGIGVAVASGLADRAWDAQRVHSERDGKERLLSLAPRALRERERTRALRASRRSST